MEAPRKTLHCIPLGYGNKLLTMNDCERFLSINISYCGTGLNRLQLFKDEWAAFSQLKDKFSFNLNTLKVEEEAILLITSRKTVYIKKTGKDRMIATFVSTNMYDGKNRIITLNEEEFCDLRKYMPVIDEWVKTVKE